MFNSVYLRVISVWNIRRVTTVIIFLYTFGVEQKPFRVLALRTYRYSGAMLEIGLVFIRKWYPTG